MLLEKLREYSERIEQTPSMYKETIIHWIIDLKPDGTFLGLSKAGDGEAKKWRGKIFVAPSLIRTRAIKPILLADNAEYTLGVSRGGSQENAQERHQTYIGTLEACYQAIQAVELGTILKFLRETDLAALSYPNDFDPKHTLTFRVNNIFPFALKEVQQWWAKHTDGEAETDTPSSEQECLLCGQIRPVLKGHPIQIKGIRGGKAALYVVSANKPAFTSYGLESSLIAPTCKPCAEGYAKGLNHLLADQSHHLHINNLAYCFWTQEEHAFSIFDFLNAPDAVSVKKLLQSSLTGKSYHLNTDDTPFYALALSASGARVAVRDWIVTTLSEVKKHLAHFFLLQRIVDTQGQIHDPLSIFRLSAAVYREAKDIPINVPQYLLRFALKGGILPYSILAEAIKRNRAEKTVTAARAALIKMLLIQNLNYQEDYLVMLDAQHPDSAYQCGRLLAVLESIQRQALGKIGATITDRYFGTASSAPASIFGTLLRGSQAHLGKLRKEKEGAYFALQEKLEQVLGNLESFPSVLDLKSQALFSLGYYHQKAADRKSIEDRKNAQGEN